MAGYGPLPARRESTGFFYLKTHLSRFYKNIKNPLQSIGVFLFSQPVAGQLSSALQGLTSVFGMGTGGPPASSTPTVDSEYSFLAPPTGLEPVTS